MRYFARMAFAGVWGIASSGFALVWPEAAWAIGYLSCAMWWVIDDLVWAPV
jgi:hypothetical protein